jgi:hypothetical protein
MKDFAVSISPITSLNNLSCGLSIFFIDIPSKKVSSVLYRKGGISKRESASAFRLFLCDEYVVSRRREKKKRLRRDDNEGYRGVTNRSPHSAFAFLAEKGPKKSVSRRRAKKKR